MTLKNKNNGGVVASRERSEHCSKKDENRIVGENVALTYIKYRDHVLFRNCDPHKMRSNVRETIGWFASENREVLILCSDRPVGLSPSGMASASGLVILKSDILEWKEIGVDKAFR